ncbi:hypothetical protein Mgra_00005590, partial [Meloidogyne graminicola]
MITIKILLFLTILLNINNFILTINYLENDICENVEDLGIEIDSKKDYNMYRCKCIERHSTIKYRICILSFYISKICKDNVINNILFRNNTICNGINSAITACLENKNDYLSCEHGFVNNLI